MKATIDLNGKAVSVDLAKPLDISIVTKPDGNSARAWYIPAMTIEPVILEGFVGDINKGGSVNFRNIQFNPHAHCTHTESVGHISKAFHSVQKSFSKYFFLAEVISVVPTKVAEDLVVLPSAFEKLKNNARVEALVIRTLPNAESKLQKDYSNSNPPFLDKKCVELFYQLGVQHLLIDMPSVDKESDEGALATHHAFWQYPHNTQFHKTITEFIFVADHIEDGTYLLELQLAAIENDAAPSRPVLYRIV